jgi:TonB family protein
MLGFRLCAVACLLAPLLGAQAQAGDAPPRILSTREPEYTADARANHVQGIVVLDLIIDRKGRPTHISFVSPLGFGLDEQARAVVQWWKFAPGTKGGEPVDMLATVEVNFKIRSHPPDERERRQAQLDAAVGAGSVQTLRELSDKKFPPAMYVLGMWETKGEHVERNLRGGLALIQKAAAANYGPALYEIALRDLSRDAARGLDEMGQAAQLGIREAQLTLADRYERGDGEPRDLTNARRYYRLCAAEGVALCEFRLGCLLLDAPGQKEQAIAWLWLAADRGVEEADYVASREAADLTPSQSESVEGLRAQLLGAQLARR